MSEFTSSREKRRGRPRGYAPWRPQAKTKILLEQVDAVLVEYERQLPLTARQVYYRLVAGGFVEKTEQGYARLCECLVRARRAGLVPFSSIRDDGIFVYSPDWFADPQEFLEETVRRARAFRRDRQAGQRCRVELWCESAGMAPQLASVANDYSVPVYTSSGFCSLTAVRSVVDRARLQDVPTVLLHLGDFDPSGEAVFESMAADAVAFLEHDRVLHLQRIIPKRIALTAEQVQEFNLETAPAKHSDSRSARWQGETCQLEALAPDRLARLVRDAIVAELDPARLRREVEAEHENRIQLLRALPAGPVAEDEDEEADV